jgi:hypothetical protein
VQFRDSLEALRATNYYMRANPDCVASCRGNIVKVWTPLSQRKEAMPPAEFRMWSNAVLDLLAEMIGTRLSELKKNAGRAA